jgi:hypothetical protein
VRGWDDALRLMTRQNITIGIDLGDSRHAVCVLSAAGEILAETAITNCRESGLTRQLRCLLFGMCPRINGRADDDVPATRDRELCSASMPARVLTGWFLPRPAGSFGVVDFFRPEGGFFPTPVLAVLRPTF